MSPIIAAMVVFCSVCAVLIVLIVISGVYFWLDYREFKSTVKSHIESVEDEDSKRKFGER